MGSVILPLLIGDGSNLVAVGCIGLALLAVVIVSKLLKSKINLSLTLICNSPKLLCAFIFISKKIINNL